MQLSEEQLCQIEKNRRAALLRLASRNVPVPVGESWRRHIGTEFAKPYFTKVSDPTQYQTLAKQQRADEVKEQDFFLFWFLFVQLMSFVTMERKCSTVYPSLEQVFYWTTLCAIEDVSSIMCVKRKRHEWISVHTNDCIWVDR